MHTPLPTSHSPAPQAPSPQAANSPNALPSPPPAPTIQITIDRLVFTGLDLTPERAEHIRTGVIAALQQQIAEAFPNGLENESRSHLISSLNVAIGDDRQLAQQIAQQLLQSLQFT